jgi:hypothetical protein
MCISNLPRIKTQQQRILQFPTIFTFAFRVHIPFCTHHFVCLFCSNTSVQMYNNLPVHQTQVVAQQPTSSAGPVINQLALQQYLAQQQQQQQQPSAQAVSLIHTHTHAQMYLVVQAVTNVTKFTNAQHAQRRFSPY